MATLKELKELEDKNLFPTATYYKLSPKHNYIIRYGKKAWPMFSEQIAKDIVCALNNRGNTELIRMIELAEEALLEIEHSDECAQIIATRALSEIRKLKGE